MRIGIVGNGVVGNATAQVYKPFHEVCVYDSVPTKMTHDLGYVLHSGIVFVCLPETELESFFCGVGYTDTNGKNFVIRSTCPIGTTRRIRERYGVPNVVHSPEFLTARTAVIDALTPLQLIIGWPTKRMWGEGTAVQQLERLYKSRFPSVPIRYMTSDESEATKLFLNGFFSVKVAFFNEVNLLCERLGLDWNTVLNGMLGDGRIAHSHTQVPGPDGKYGFGGACLPKDLATLVEHFDKDIERDLVTKAALRRNATDRTRPNATE